MKTVMQRYANLHTKKRRFWVVVKDFFPNQSAQKCTLEKSDFVKLPCKPKMAKKRYFQCF